MTVKIRESANEFSQELLKRQKGRVKDFTVDQLAEELRRYYSALDNDARRAQVRKTLTMYANYENKFYGYVTQDGRWQDYITQENDYTFSIPLFKAHVDTGITFYAKAQPQYVAKPLRKDYMTSQLSRMCQAMGNAELTRMLDKKKIQREALFLFLAGDSYRHITNEVTDDSPRVEVENTEVQVLAGIGTKCLDCGKTSGGEGEACPDCLSENVEPTEVQTEVPVSTSEEHRLPRPQLYIPNPVMMQTPHTADSRGRGFTIKRQTTRILVAEYLYQVDLQGGDQSKDFSSDALDRASKNPVSNDLGQYVSSLNQTVGEVEMWLDPSEYGLYFVDGKSQAEKHPEGMYIHIVGDKLIRQAPVKRSREWVKVTSGIRPASEDGTGMYHLAELNDLINNGINLEYAILHTVGFPTTLLRSRYLSKETSALDVVLVNNLPDEVGLNDIIHRVPAQNASGMLGILSQRFEGYMQYIGGTWSPMGGASDIRSMMGTATGASAVQEMMADRLGLAVQMRVQADVDTIFSALEYIQLDTSPANRQYLSEQYGESVADMFFSSDLRALIGFAPAKGTDEPQMDSVTAFKAQTFGGIVASLTGIREFDKSFFYDFVAMMGEAFNLPASVGTGRKERQVAKNFISKIQMLYRQEGSKQSMGDDVEAEMAKAGQLFTQVIQEDMIMMQTIPSLQTELYDFEAMKETYSDWMQSNEGQNSPMCVRLAVGLLFDSAVQAIAQKRMMEMEEQAQLQAMMNAVAGQGEEDPLGEAEDGVTLDEEQEEIAEEEGEVPDGIKRDGTRGAGRPRDVPDAEEPAISDTEDSTAPIAFDQGVPQDGGVDFALGAPDA